MKRLAVFILGMFLMASQAHAAYAPATPAIVGGGIHGGAVLPLFAGAVTGAIFVEIMNAEGVSFPACGDKWLKQPQAGTKCFSEYPDPIHKDGV